MEFMAAKCSERNIAKSSAPVQAAIFEKVSFLYIQCDTGIYNVLKPLKTRIEGVSP